MAPVTDEELDREYEKNDVQGKVPAAHIKKMREIAKALTNVTLMKWALKSLSDKMAEQYKTRVDKTVAGVVGWKQVKAAMEKADREEGDVSRHLLTTVLADFEQNNGFKCFQTTSGHPRIIQMTGLVSGPGFLATVGAGHMAKDYVTIDHGVYSHRIQWYCMYAIQKENKAHFGDNLGELYKEFSKPGSWMITFDRLGQHQEKTNGNRTIDPFDFRTPEQLNRYLRESTDALAECPLVAAYMQSKKLANITNWKTVKRITAARKLFPACKSKLDGWKKLSSNKAVEELLKQVLSAQQLLELSMVVVDVAKTDSANLMTWDKDAGTYKAGLPK
jgi:hypothetical protein